MLNLCFLQANIHKNTGANVFTKRILCDIIGYNTNALKYSKLYNK